MDYMIVFIAWVFIITPALGLGYEQSKAVNPGHCELEYFNHFCVGVAFQIVAALVLSGLYFFSGSLFRVIQGVA